MYPAALAVARREADRGIAEQAPKRAEALSGGWVHEWTPRDIFALAAIFAERVGSVMALKRDFRLQSGERALIVEDVMTTGGSTRETIEVARAAGGQVIGAASIVDRSGATVNALPGDFRFDALTLNGW